MWTGTAGVKIPSALKAIVATSSEWFKVMNDPGNRTIESVSQKSYGLNAQETVNPVNYGNRVFCSGRNN